MNDVEDRLNAELAAAYARIGALSGQLEALEVALHACRPAALEDLVACWLSSRLTVGVVELHKTDLARVAFADLLPPCPTCGGSTWVDDGYNAFDQVHERSRCPHCVDGKVSIEQLVATYNGCIAQGCLVRGVKP